MTAQRNDWSSVAGALSRRPIGTLIALALGVRSFEHAMPTRRTPRAGDFPVDPEIRERIITEIRKLCGTRSQITNDTEISYDLGLAGDDLDEFLGWMYREFRIDFSEMNNRRYPLDEPPGSLHGWRGEAIYASMTLGDLLTAVAAKRWID